MSGRQTYSLKAYRLLSAKMESGEPVATINDLCVALNLDPSRKTARSSAQQSVNRPQFKELADDNGCELVPEKEGRNVIGYKLIAKSKRNPVEPLTHGLGAFETLTATLQQLLAEHKKQTRLQEQSLEVQRELLEFWRKN